MKYIAIAAVVACLANPINANAFGLGGLGDKLDSIGDKVGLKKNDKTSSASANKADRCAAPVQAEEELSFTEKGVQVALDKIIKELSEVLGGDIKEATTKVNSYCDADRKMAKVDEQTVRLGNYVISSLEKTNLAVENSDAAQKQLALTSDNGLQSLAGDIGSISGDIKKLQKKALKNAKKAKQVNTALLADSMTDLLSVPKPSGFIAMHYQAVASFVKDNPVWIKDNLKQANVLKEQGQLLVLAIKASKDVSGEFFHNQFVGLNQKKIEAASKKKGKKLEKQAMEQYGDEEL